MDRQLCRGLVSIISFEESLIGNYLNETLSAENFDIRLTIFRGSSSNDDTLGENMSEEMKFIVFVEIPLNLEVMFKKYVRNKYSHVKIICCHLLPKRIVCDFGINYRHLPDMCAPANVESSHSIHRTTDLIEISSDICRIILNDTLHPCLYVQQCYSYERFVTLKLPPNCVSTSVVVFGCNLLSFNIIRCLLDKEIFSLLIVDEDVVHRHDLSDGIYSDSDLFKKKCTIFRQKFTSLNKNLSIIDCDTSIKAMCLEKWISFKQQNAIVILTTHENSLKRYVHKMCLYTELPIIDVGSEYLKFHINISVPFQTETYFSFNDAPEKISYPLCTIKSFPSSIEHCIQWALQKGPSMINRKLPALQTWIDCLKYSRIVFEKYFNHKPRQLLVNIPENNRKADGVLFWSEHKLPQPLIFSIDDQICFDFVLCLAKLVASFTNIVIADCDKVFVSEVMDCTTVPNFVPKQAEAISEVSLHENSRDAIASTNFTMDNDDHCLLLFAATNLRANVYGIPSINIDDFKKTSLNLVPCSKLAMYTAVVCTMKEFEKLVVANGRFKEVSVWTKNYSVNLSESDLFLICDPLPSKRLTLNSICFNEWDSWTIYEKSVNDTLDVLLQSLKQKSKGVECNMLVMENGDSCKTLFMSILPESEKRKQTLVRQLMDIGQHCHITYVVLVACFDIDDEDQCLSPFVKYYFLNSGDVYNNQIV